ncbi:MAG: PAS domain-containing sensor histidine kinase, partial [Bacteroidia bacterium]
NIHNYNNGTSNDNNNDNDNSNNDNHHNNNNNNNNNDSYYNDEGEFMGFIAVENEVTDRKQQEEQIIQSEAKLSAVINTIPDSIFYKNAEGKYELVNKAFGELIGQKPEYITGKTDNDLYSTNTAEKIVKDDKELLTAEGIKRTEGEVNKSKGKKILIETTKRTVVDNNGKIKGLVGISRDITEIRNAQQKIIESEERLKITTNSLNIGIFDWDIESNNLIWDESMYRLFEVNEKDFLGAYEAFTKCVITEDLDRVNTEVAHSIETGEKLDTSFKIYSEQGEKYIKATGTVFLNKEGNATRMVGINYDITPEKESEQKLKEYTSNLEKINSELDQFAYVVSHDLKAPLRAINNLSTWIQEDLEDSMDDDIKEQFSLLRGRVLRMEGLINGILEYSRAGRIKSNNQKVNTAQLIVDLCDTLKTHDKIVYEVNEKAPNLFTEKVALEQVFSNLISNAIKYNDKEIAKIKIDFEDQVDFVQFSVKDNGAGISDKYFDKIFVIFQTLQARDQFESTGVGLAIVKKIIEDKGGKIWVESEPKSGATFYFTWPKEQLQPIELN